MSLIHGSLYSMSVGTKAWHTQLHEPHYSYYVDYYARYLSFTPAYIHNCQATI